MKVKNQQDFYSGLMFVAVGLLFAYRSTEYAMGSSMKPGPGYFPMMISVVLAILGGVVLFKSLTIEAQDGAPVGAFAWRPLLVIVAAITVFGFALPRLGLIATVPLLVMLVSAAADTYRLRSVLLTCVVLTTFSWLVFVLGLKLTIPVWPTFI